MRKWQSHKIVEAEPITAIWPGRENGKGPGATIELASGEKYSVDEPFLARGEPEEGGYLVRYVDGYLSWSPKKAFEEGYTELKESA